LPLSLVKDTLTKTLSEGDRLLQVQSFADAFGPNSKRKRPNLTMTAIEDMVAAVNTKGETYDEIKDVDLHKND